MKVTLMLITVYMICWFPYHLLGIWLYVDPDRDGIKHLARLLSLLIVLNSAVNPFIYGIVSKQKLREFKNMCLHGSQTD